MLEFLDLLFTCLHLFLIGFNLFGWIWPASRRAHLISLIITLAFWFLAGYWYGWGYCPLTDWHWQIKNKLGESKLPVSFIKYMADKITGGNFSSELVDGLTLCMFILALLLSVYVNFFGIKSRTKKN